ncbi:amino acid adenylation domain-containing protein [Rhodanobacter aciditrophus]|uniref:amino acid adenylation domain-containing protein n=1 Tax=Rhodanobacter aciditrophus TaxID=1623218 RepID=UPI003CF52581
MKTPMDAHAALSAVDYDPFASPALERVVPSTEAQREIWLAAKLGEQASLAYNEAVALHLHGALDRAALLDALQALVDRHDALRASFGPDGETFCVAAGVTLAVRQTALDALDPAARAAALEERRTAAVLQPFELESGPLFRAELVCLGEREHVLLLCAHHLVCDGWSWWVIVRELGALYGLRSGAGAGGAALPPAPSFADYALRLAEPADRRASAADEAWWVAHHAHRAPALDLPGDRPRPPRRGFASAREDHLLDADVVGALRQLGARHGASLFAVLLGSFAGLLGRLAGQDEVVLGIPAAAQANEGLGNLVGHGVNLLPLRCSADPALPFAQVLAAASNELLDALEHQRCTFGRLLQQLDIARDPARLPLVSVLFNIDQALEQEAAAFPGLRLDFASVPRRYENFELFVNAVQEHGGLRLECQYNSGLFDAATVRRWLRAYETLLRAAVAQPDAEFGSLPIADAAMREELAALQPAPTPFDANRLAHQHFEAQCARTPEREAVRAGTGSLSYAALEARANRIAHALRARGVRRGALVGLALDRDTDLVASVLGVLKAGAGYVPLDPSYPAERLTHMADDSGLAVLLTQGAHVSRFDLHGRPVLALDAMAEELAALPATPLPTDADAATPDTIAYVIYTSGSTGKPKGVAVPHRATANFLHAVQQTPSIRTEDRLVAVTTLSFDIAFMELMLPLSVGACMVMATRDEARDGTALRRLVEASDSTYLQATPSGWRLLLGAGWQGRADFTAVSGGEPLAPDLAAALLARCGAVWNGYGPTECTVYATMWKVEHPERGISIGRPVANTTVWVLDERRQPCPPGVPGELWIGGASVAQGYLNRPELTAERFVDDPFSDLPGARLYRTGDRGRWRADGNLEHLGRADFQIKLRGFRIEPGEIEAQLAGQPPVTQALVVMREDRPGDARLVAYLVSETPVDEAALRSRLRERLPEYMLPQHFVVLPALPLLPNGKIDRARLPAPLAAAAPVGAHAAPRDELERQVAQAMAAVLGGLEPGLDDDFFERGGHSLLAAQLTARLNRDLGLALPLRTLFEAPTVARLAAAIRAAGAAGKPAPRAIARLADREHAPLSLMQQRVWYLEQLQPGRVTYHTPSAHRLHGALNLAAFEQALRTMVRRQPVLRTSIEPGESGATQRIHAALEVELPREDLSSLPANEREDWLRRRLDALIAEPFDLAVPPLFRARLFRLGEEEHVFFFMTHHIIWDGWSFDLFYQEMTALYAAFCAGRPDPLPPLAVEYGDFAAWQRQWMQGEELERQLGHWLSRLRGNIEPLELPADRTRPTRMSGAGATEWVELPAARLDAVRALARQAGVTSFMVLLAVYYVLLHRLGGQRDLIVGTPVRGRDAVELEPVMGFFVNALPLRLAIDPQAGFLDTLHAVRTVVLDAFACPDVPFEHLVKALRLPRDESRPPLAQAMFSYQDVRGRACSWGGLRHERLPVFQRGSAHDLGLWFVELEHRLLGGMIFNADIFEPATAARYRRGYETLLESALADPRRPIAQLSLLPADELAQLRRWNATAAAIPVSTMHGAFERQAAATPERTALRCGRETLSYRALDERANRIAHGLIAQGVRPGDLVGIALERGPAMLAALLGTLKAGAGYVPLDPGFPAERLAYMVADAGLAALLTQQSLAARFDLPGRPLIALDAPPPGWDALPTSAPALAVDPSSIAYVIYTSGSTGRPKGVAILHRAVANFLASMAERPGLHADDRLLAVTTLSFDIAVLELLGPLGVGGEVVLATREQALDGSALAALLADHGVTLMQATPATWRLLLQAGWQGSARFRALCGGEALAPDLAAALLPRCAELWNLYGPTETTVWSTCARVEPDQPIHIGTSIANTSVWVLDERRQPCPLGVPGELWIGGAGVALGYLHRPELTAERFVDDPFSDLPGARLYRTGDRGRWRADGNLEHLGRADFQIKLRGFRIEPGEIESIAREDSAVADAAAVVHEFAAGDQRLVLYVVADEAEATLLPRLRAALEAQLPGYMRPQHILRLQAFPQTPNGKLDRKALPLPTAVAGGRGPAPGSTDDDPRRRYLAAVWCELVGVSAVSPQDNFFDVGGHSLLAVELAARVQRETGVRLNLLDIASGTLATLAGQLPEPAAAGQNNPFGHRLRRLLGLR